MRRDCSVLRVFFAIVVAVILVFQTGCQQQAKTPAPPAARISQEAPKAAPKITFENTVYDFGEVSSEKKYNGQFKFTNTGDALLKITDVKKCCGAVVTLDKTELSPGEKGMLKVEYNSGRGSGLMTRQLHVSSNDQTNPDVTLTIKARIVPKVDYQPSRINLVLNKENAGCPKITITSLDKQPFSIKGFQSTGESITADFDPSVETTKFVLEPKVDMEKLQKRSAGFVAISLTHPELDRVNIYFSTLQPFRITPPSIILFNPEPQKPIIKEIGIVSNYGEVFEIESASSEAGLVKMLSQEKTDKGYRLEVEVTPPPRDDTGGFNDVLRLRLDNGEDLSLKCYVRYSDMEE